MRIQYQRTAILTYLKAPDSGPLTALIALRRWGCLRLAARIFELREDGYAIGTLRWGVNRKTVAGYVLGVTFPPMP